MVVYHILCPCDQVAPLCMAVGYPHLSDEYTWYWWFFGSDYISQCGDERRFTNEKQFISYIGVVLGIFNSGGSENNLGVTPWANTILRPYIFESAWIAIRKGPEIQAYYKLHLGNNSECIIVKVAHKMVKRILSVIKTAKPYQIIKNLELDNNIKLPDDADLIDEIIRYWNLINKTGLMSDITAPVESIVMLISKLL